jgi:hypothetical protein
MSISDKDKKFPTTDDWWRLLEMVLTVTFEKFLTFGYMDNQSQGIDKSNFEKSKESFFASLLAMLHNSASENHYRPYRSIALNI